MNLTTLILNGSDDVSLKNLNKQLDYLNKQLRNNKIKKSNLSIKLRKQRARNLIILGSNFEILGYEKEDTRVILGFLKENISLIPKNREHYKQVGIEVLEEKRKKTTMAEEKLISSEQLKELLIIAKTNDISVYIQRNFKKKLWDTLSQNEFLNLKQHFNK